MKLVAALAVCLSLGATAAAAGAIEKACLKSGRNAANRSLCGCIQQVADVTLDRRDQKLAAKFFRDPHQAQEVRQSKRRNHEVFWRKYKRFGDTAQVHCARG